MKKTIIVTGIFVVTALVALMIFVRLTSRTIDNELNFAEAKRGGFEISVINTGELVAENSVDIKGPNTVQNRNFRSSPVKITDLVPEGTTVKKGDYIATLDRSDFNNTLKDEADELNDIRAKLEMKILDTAVTMSTLRDDIKNQSFVVEEARITLEQSKYEPPATQRKSELELDKAMRLLTQKRKIYSLRSAQTLSELQVLKSNFKSQQSKVNDLTDILNGFTIVAPSDGMVIYKKNRLGVKNKTGSMLSPWDPVVATLPDLSSMLSKVYVSEIDVSKIKPGLEVQLTIDAFRGKSFNGKVFSIANIGEQFSNSDSKVFEVLVKLDESYQNLKPSMTTGNKIIVRTYSDVVYVPTESVHTGLDSIPFVYTENNTKQVVVLGEANEKNIIIEKGLTEGASVWLSTPEDYLDFKMLGADLIPVIKEKERIKRADMEKLRKENILLTKSEDEEKVFVPDQRSGGSSASSSSGGI